jgi:murein L,D-transpeptidase YafK
VVIFTFLAFKDTRVVEVYAAIPDGTWRLIRRYPILAASGVAGPKLREGDMQVPEGTYAVTLLNPNSRFHVSLRLGYPNDFDREMARSDGRTDLGGDIMIHGRALSVGCLAVGDDAAEDFFTLAAAVGLEHVKVVISHRFPIAAS